MPFPSHIILAKDSQAPLPPGQRREKRPAPKRKYTFSPKRLFLETLLAFSLALLAFPYVVSWCYQDRALPGVSIQGMKVTNLDQPAITASLNARYANFLRQPLTLTYANRTWQLSLAELGIGFDLKAVATEALQVGKQGGPIRRLRDLWYLWRFGHDLAPRLLLDQPYLQHYLLKLAAELESPAQDAKVQIGATEVVRIPSVQGTQVLVDATAAAISQALQQLTPQQVALLTRPLPPLIGDEVAKIAEGEAQTLLNHNLLLKHGEQTWPWGKAEIAPLLRVDELPTHTLRVEIDPYQLKRAVKHLGRQALGQGIDPHLRFEAGALKVLQEGREGWRLKPEATVKLLSETLRQPQEASVLELPTEPLYPRVTPQNLATLGIKELVSEGKSSFAGSAAYRITNIKAGAARLDGLLIAPGEEFSFNKAIGEINAENGFVEGYAVIGNRTKLEWGGGVCQDSTTVFRAAFWAGLPITERHAHPYAISWYNRFGLGERDGEGLDAAIFTGLSDLKFGNDTGNWLLLQTTVDEAQQTFTVQLYGTKPNRRVEIDGPHLSNETKAITEPVYIDDPSKPIGYLQQSDVARSGRDLIIYRLSFENEQLTKREAFRTSFQAWPDVFVRGTKKETLTP